MALRTISHRDLYAAPWNGLIRLARSLGLRVSLDEPECFRPALVEAVARGLSDSMLADAARRGRIRREQARQAFTSGYKVTDSRASSDGAAR